MEETEAALRLLHDEAILGESQYQALSTHIMKRRLSCIWGPPGAGKTHSIAIHILFLCYLQQMNEEDSSFHVLVNAFTNSAIDTCLEKIASIVERFGRIFTEFQAPRLLRVRSTGDVQTPEETIK